jgi:hyperosmotically inducible protein
MLALTLAFAGPALAQSASESFHKAGEETENAGSSVGHAAVSAFHGTATATKDTAITAKVKTSLNENDLTKGGDIHVTTVAGVVTLRGSVTSDKVADEAVHVAEGTGGVKSVKNRLHVKSTS